MNHIIEIEDLKMLGRPLNKMTSEHKLYALIAETEMLQIKPIIGDSLYLTLVENANNENPQDKRIKLLLEGGIYNPSEYSGTSCSDKRYFEGLKKAVAYFVYAQYVMTGEFESTRYGITLKDGDYSSHISDKQRSNYYNNLVDIGKGYLKDCIAFCKVSGLIKTTGKTLSNMGGVTIKKIG